MKTLNELLANNRSWAADISAQDPDFFERLSHQQSPQYFWIGCSDSRVPANQIVGLMPGEMFVHRNVANVVAPEDPNCLAVLQFAVDVLKVRHVIVCGHYGCAGIAVALRQVPLGLPLVDEWIKHIEQVRRKHTAKLAMSLRSAERLCELNVIEQTVNVCQTAIVQNAWRRRQPLCVTAWIYAVSNGLIRNLGITVTSPDKVAPAYAEAVSTIDWNGCFHVDGGRPDSSKRVKA